MTNVIANAILDPKRHIRNQEDVLMFFKNEAISAKILSVVDLEWESKSESSGKRPYHALSFRSRGSSLFTTENGSVRISSGEIGFFPANLVYTQNCLSERVLVIHFTSDQSLPDNILRFAPKNPSYYERKFTELCTVWNKKQLGYEYECKTIFYKILLEMEREHAESKVDKLAVAIEYIHEHFTDHTLTVEKLSRLCGMSDTYFRQLFVDRFNETPLKYINSMRLVRSKELLQSGYHTIEEIAELCGFKNIHYFSLFFKREMGCPPSSYRKMMLEQKY